VVLLVFAVDKDDCENFTVTNMSETFFSAVYLSLRVSVWWHDYIDKCVGIVGTCKK
jgi:hypothetical protein